jgi:transcriptional regulator with XRE-family HTH domain
MIILNPVHHIEEMRVQNRTHPANVTTSAPEAARSDMATIGEELHRARLDLGLSLQKLAEASGISTGMISQIERGLANPSVNTVSKLASALGLQLGIFFEPKPPTPERRVVRKGERPRIGIPDPSFVYELLVPDLNRSLEFVWVESAPGATTESSPFQHEGEECGLVLQGTLEVHLGDEVYVLEAGDSIVLDCRIPHWYRNIGAERVLSVWAITPPSF